MHYILFLLMLDFLSSVKHIFNIHFGVNQTFQKLHSPHMQRLKKETHFFREMLIWDWCDIRSSVCVIPACSCAVN